MRTLLRCAITASFLGLVPLQAHAQLAWNWSFGSNSGSFFTTGATYAPGVYTLFDFSVAASGEGATLGSWSGGQYLPSGIFTNTPYDMYWDGTAVTLWTSAGDNFFDWWVFTDLGNPNRYFFFGWETGNLNTAGQASYYDFALSTNQPSYVVTVVPAATVVPEPISLVLLGTGLFGVAAARRRRRTAA